MKPWIDTILLDDDPFVHLAALGAGCFSWLKPQVLQEDRVPSFLLPSGPPYTQLLSGAPRRSFCSKDCISRPGTTHFPLSHLCLLNWPCHHSFWGAYFDRSFSPHPPPPPPQARPQALTMRSGGGVLRMKHLIWPFSPCRACWVWVLEMMGGPVGETASYQRIGRGGPLAGPLATSSEVYTSIHSADI